MNLTMTDIRHRIPGLRYISLRLKLLVNNLQSLPSVRSAVEQDLLPVLGKPAQIIIFKRPLFRLLFRFLRLR